MNAPVAVLHRRRFLDIPQATLTSVGSNVYEVWIPKDAPIHRLTRREPTMDGWEEAIFLIEDVESQPAVASGENGQVIKLHVVVL